MRALSVLLLVCAAAAAGEARWIRYAALSPDGARIAFSYLGDLWIVSADGGEARPLTRHPAHDTRPVWSPDGKTIAFASARHGNFDVFLVDAGGGRERRLTFHSSNDTPSCFTPDGARVVFSSSRLDAPASCLGSPWFPELYSVSVDGGRPRQELTTPALEARWSPDGARLVYEDLKGYENAWRKRHRSSVTRDVVVFDRETGAHRALTTFRGEDRDPVWSPDGATVFYLSEQGGSFNVWSVPAEGGEQRALTNHGPHPARFLSVARDGTLAYTVHGALHVLRPGGAPRALKVLAAAGDRANPRVPGTFRDGATEFAVSPAEDEVAFVVRGEVFVASVEHGTTKRITATPWQERSVAWAPDGKTLYYAAERDGSWSLYSARRKREAETHFFLSTVLEETPVLVGPDEAYRPVPSPDGKLLAYLHNADEIRVLDLATGVSRTAVPAARNYAYTDHDIEFAWSPDSRWLACTLLQEGRWIDDVAVVEVATGALTNMTLSGYDEGMPRFFRDGRSLAFYSNRYGRRSHASGGSEGDLFALDLTQAAHDRAKLSEEEFALLKKKEEEEGSGEEKEGEGAPEEKGGDGEEKKEDDAEEPPPPVEIEMEGREERLRRITLHSATVGGYDVSPDGETVVYFAEMDGKWDLWLNEIRKASTRKLLEVGADGPGRVVFAKEGGSVFVLDADGAIVRVSLDGEAKPVGYAAEMVVDGAAERAYVFEHAWRQVRRKFYEPGLHGADWDGLREAYGALLDHVDDNHAFAELMSEMLGELNASHTGAYARFPREGADETAALGLLYDEAHAGDGLKVAEVLPRGPCDKAGSSLAPGAVITHLDGTALTAATNPWPLLNRKAGKYVLLQGTLPGGGAFEQVVKPLTIGAERELLYRRWRKQRRELVDRLSEGRVGYVHVQGMDDDSFRHVFQEVLGRHGDRQALVVDTRWNGGGWLHDDLVRFLGATPYAIFHPRGKERGAYGGEPLHRWARPVVVLQNEGNYSDAHIFPYAFKTLGLGKLVGTPVAGTGTAVWWEEQIDPDLVFGIPQVGMVTPDGRYLENLEREPDVEVFNTPEDYATGRDRQLEAAVQELLK